MFRTLLESHVPPTRWGSGTAASLAVHTALVAAAIMATADAGAARDRPVEQTVKFLEHAKADDPRPASAPPPPDATLATPPLGFQVLPPMLDIPVHIPEVDLTRVPTTTDDWTARGGVAGGTASGVGDGSPLPADHPLTAWQVEKPAMTAPGTPTPRYPDVLRTAGVEGEAVVSFVVDTTGRVDPQTIIVRHATHELFAAAVRLALPGMRFIPAEADGRKVRQLVQQPFAFTIAR